MAHPDWLEALLAKLPAELASQLSAFQTEVLIASLVTAAITVVFVFYLVTRPKAGGGTTVVLAGPCNAGKTTLFYQLKDGSTHNGTVASMQENQAAVAVKSQNGRKLGQVSLVDVPGHERLRNKLDHHLKDAAAVVLVVDSTDITPSKTEAAESLFEILTHPSIARRRVPVLIACNKTDQTTQALSQKFICRTLENQVDKMRKTRTSLSPEAAAKAAVLGKPDKPFTFDTLRNPISRASMSAFTGDIAEVHAFLVGFAR